MWAIFPSLISKPAGSRWRAFFWEAARLSPLHRGRLLSAEALDQLRAATRLPPGTLVPMFTLELSVARRNIKFGSCKPCG